MRCTGRLTPPVSLRAFCVLALDERPMHAMRGDEEHAKQIFLRFLAEAEPQHVASCKPGADPPDYLVNLGHEILAVEVTNILRHVELGRSLKAPAIEIYDSLSRFIVRLEDSAKKRGILRGAYGVSARPTEDFGASRDEVVSRLLEFIRETRDLESTEDRFLTVNDGRSIWRMKKYGLHADCVYPMASSTGGYGELVRQLEDRVPAHMNRKAALLREIQEPVILLLIDGLHLPLHDDWLKVVTEKAAEPFHSVLRISRTQDGWQVLRSRCHSWLRDGVRTNLSTHGY